MNQKDFNEAAKEAAQSIHIDAARVLSAAVNGDAPDLEAVRKIYNDTKDVSGAVVAKTTDPYANLAVLNITVINGTTQTQVKAASVVQAAVVEEDQPQLHHDIVDVEPLPARIPAPAQYRVEMEDIDVNDLLDLLDD